MLPGAIVSARVQQQIERLGYFTKIQTGVESSITRSPRYSDVVSRSSTEGVVRLKSFPIRFNPSPKDMQRAGIIIPVEVIFWYSLADLLAAGSKFDDIQETTGSVLNESTGESYLITKKTLVAQSTSSFVYFTIGANSQ